MAVSPHAFSANMAAPFAQSGRANFGQAASSGLSLKWSALQDCSAVVAMMAGYQPEALRADVRNFPALIRPVGGWRAEQAARDVTTLMAIMEAGIASLLAAQARGAMPVLAARALWQEFIATRQAIMALLPASGVSTRLA